MADFTNRNADETKEFILTFDENGGSPEYTKIEDANGVDRTAEVVELLGINDKASLSDLKVLQVVFNSYSTETAMSSSLYQDSGLSATIKPISVNSKIYVFASNSIGAETGDTGQCRYVLRILGGVTTVIEKEQRTRFGTGDGGFYQAPLDSSFVGQHIPNTTDTIEYKLQGRVVNSGNLFFQRNNEAGTIMLIEVAGEE